MSRDFPVEEAKRIRSKWLDDYTACGAEVKSRLVATGGVRKPRRLLCGCSTTQGSALGGLHGGIKREETRVLRRRGGVCTRLDR